MQTEWSLRLWVTMLDGIFVEGWKLDRYRLVWVVLERELFR